MCGIFDFLMLSENRKSTFTPGKSEDLFFFLLMQPLEIYFDFLLEQIFYQVFRIAVTRVVMTAHSFFIFPRNSVYMF